MFKVKSPSEAYSLIMESFKDIRLEDEVVSVYSAFGRVLAEDVYAAEDVPAFDRSTVDGYAVHSADTFGATESLPSMLTYKGEVFMGQSPDFEVEIGECAAIPTGGELPKGTDAVAMVEFCEIFGKFICIGKSAAPGSNVITRGEDAKCGNVILKKGTVLCAHHIGALCAIGVSEVKVTRKLKVGVVSTGDELIPPEEKPVGAQIRNVNSGMLMAGIQSGGYSSVDYGIVKDNYDDLKVVLTRASEECDVVLVSGGSSVGTRDATARIIEEMGNLILHGIAVKPGKPTIAGRAGNKVLFGLPGHPMAAYYIFSMFALPVMDMISGRDERIKTFVTATLKNNIPSNHGREEYVAIALEKEGDKYYAVPCQGKSGLITTLTHADGFVRVLADSEGLDKDTEVEVYVF